MMGQTMKFMKAKQNNIEQSAQMHVMVPVDPNSQSPIESLIISHKHNSHTLKPKIVNGPDYPESFQALNGIHLIDFPGMFESKGLELDVAMHLTL